MDDKTVENEAGFKYEEEKYFPFINTLMLKNVSFSQMLKNYRQCYLHRR